MTLLIVLACVVAYLVVGALLGRRKYVRKYHAKYAQFVRDYPYTARERPDEPRSRAREAGGEAALATLLLWPVLGPSVGLAHLVSSWLHAPVERDERAAEQRKARIRDLRADADSWDAKRTTGTDAERAMATQLAQLCRDQADELAKEGRR